MSVRETHDMICPRCGRDDHIDVEIQMWTRLTAHGADTDESARGHDQEWDDASRAA